MGSCHTADGAYSLLCDLREDREDALKTAQANDLRVQAKRIRAQRLIDSADQADQLEGRADLAEIEASEATYSRNLAAAQAELDFINTLIDRLQPYRQFGHLPDAHAHEACQQEEWRLELESRAQNYLLTTGTIPTDHFGAMRQHPEWSTRILPAIESVKSLMASGQTAQLLHSPSPVAHLLLGNQGDTDSAAE